MRDTAGNPAALALRESRGRREITGFGRPFGLAAGAEGTLLVADMDLHAIACLSADCDAVWWLGPEPGGWSAPAPIARGEAVRAAPRAPDLFDGPHSVAVAADGNLHVVTYYSPALMIFSSDGAQLARRGDVDGRPRLRGPASGQFDAAGRLLVTEFASHAVLRIDGDGRFLDSLGGGATQAFGTGQVYRPGWSAGCFDRPHMCNVTADGSLLVADTWNHRIQRFDEAGRWCGWLGDGGGAWRDTVARPVPGQVAGALNAPVAVSVVERDRFLVTDWGNHRLQYFSDDGRVCETRDDLGLDRPYDARHVHGRLAVADSHHGRVLMLED